MQFCARLLTLFLLTSVFSAAPAASAESSIAAETLTVAFYEEMPYQFVDENGETAGLLVDLFNEVAMHAGYTVEYKLYGSLRDCVNASQRGEVNLILGVQGTTPYDLKETVELYESSLIIAQKTDIDTGAKNKQRYYLAGYNYYATNRAIIYTLGANRYIVVDRFGTLIELLAEDKINVAIVDKAVFDYATEHRTPPLYATTVNNSLDSIKYTVASAEGDNALFRELNTAILDMRISGDYNQIEAAWIQEEKEPNWRGILFGAAIILGILLCVFTAYYSINRRIRRLLERELSERTRSLRETNEQLESHVRQLQFESELRRKLIRNAHSGMVMIDCNYYVQLMNTSARKMSGYFARDMQISLSALPCFREAIEQIDGDIFLPGFSVDNCLITIRINDAPPSEFRLNVHQIKEADTITGALITLEDVTMEQRLLRASYEKDKHLALNSMIAGIAHEIKNPLMSIRTYAALIKSNFKDADFRASFSEFVPREADRINDLVESLVSYARPARGKKLPFDICGLVQECAYLSVVAKRKNDIAVSVCAEGKATIFAKRDQIKQMVINIMLNGIEAMEAKQSLSPSIQEGFELKVKVETSDDFVCLTIEDNGIGMNLETQQRCTNLFYTTKEQGTGLGLALSAQYISENDGWMSIASEEGRFTRFIVWFPLAKEGVREDA